MRLNEKHIKDVSRESGLSGALIKKITWNVRVSFLKNNTDSGEEELKTEFFELGLRISDARLFERLKTPLGLKCLADTIRAYANACPVVINWITRGDFSPGKVPPSINRSHVMHASRTAGRLKAELIRQL